MIPIAAKVRLTPADRAVLEARVRAPTTEQRDAFRARGSSCWRTKATRPVRLPARSARCRERSALGAAGSPAKAWPVWPTSRGPARHRSTPARPADAFWLSWNVRRLPDSRAGTRPLIAAELGDVHEQRGLAFPAGTNRRHSPGRKSWCESNDPEFVAKAADVVGLYMAPPENAIVVCV